MCFYEISPIIDEIDPIIWVGVPRRSNGQEVDVWMFTLGKTAEVQEELILPVKKKGGFVDFTLAEFSIPIVSERFADTIKETVMGDCQLVPARLDDGRRIFILNVTASVECFDRKHSEFTTEMDNIDRATGEFIAPYERIGMVINLMIDQAAVGKHQMFRIPSWPRPIVISGDLADKLTAAHLTGFELTEVN